MAAMLPQIALPPEHCLASRFNPEFDLLLACCRGAEVSPLRVNWQRVAELAQDHGVIPRVYEKLCGKIPNADSVPLRTLYDANVRKAMILTSELLRIYDEFRRRGIDGLPYKGLALAHQLYGDVAARQFSDLDLLVRRADVPRATAVLARLGYERALKLSNRQESAYLCSGYEYTFDGALGQNVIELKWAVAPRFYAIDIDIDRFFERAVEVEIAGKRLKTLCPEDALLVLCIHAARHQWSELSWLCDLSRMQQVCDLDWNSVRERAARLCISRIVATTLLLAHDLLGSSVPEIFPEDSIAQLLCQDLSGKIAFRNEHDPESLSYFRTMLQVRERWQDRARFVTRLLLTPGLGEWNAVRLPDFAFGLYPLVRISRLIRRVSAARRSATKKLDSPEPPEAVLHPPG